MISKRLWIYPLAVSFLLSCSRAPSTSAPRPTPLPTQPVEPALAPSVDSTSQGPWMFTYHAGRTTYIVRRTATIQRADSISSRDTTSKNTTSTNITREAFTFEPGDGGIRITASVDSFTSVPSNPATPPNLHPQISAVLTADALTIDSHSDTVVCNPINSALTTDTRNLVVAFPDSLTPGLAWKDSVDIRGCQAGIPTSGQVIRSFLVKGELPGQERVALQVIRSDTVHLNGEGGLQRHRVSIHAIGTGTATYYLDVMTGQLFRLEISQVLSVDVITLAGQSQFQQHLDQEFLISP